MRARKFKRPVRRPSPCPSALTRPRAEPVDSPIEPPFTCPETVTWHRSPLPGAATILYLLPPLAPQVGHGGSNERARKQPRPRVRSGKAKMPPIDRQRAAKATGPSGDSVAILPTPCLTRPPATSGRPGEIFGSGVLKRDAWQNRRHAHPMALCIRVTTDGLQELRRLHPAANGGGEAVSPLRLARDHLR